MSVAELHEHLTARWAETLWPQPPPGEWFSVFAAIPDPHGDRRTIWARTPLELATRIEPLIGTHNLWLGVATRTANLGNRRGTAQDCGHITGLWFDLDINGPNHTRTDYPPDEQTAMGIVEQFPLPPTIVVHTGGGLQPWWLFNEPVPVDQLDDLLEAWAHTWTERFAALGYHIDNVFDISRVMRIPGTLNHKTDPPQPVRIWECETGGRYGVDDIDQHLTTPPPRPAPTKQPTVPYIGPTRPGDAFNAAHTGRTVLEAAGWTHVRDDHTGGHYRHPTATAQTSATVYSDDGHTTIWTDSYPNLEPRRPYDPFGLHTALHFNGDWRASTRDLSARGYGERPVTNEDVWELTADLTTRNANTPHTTNQNHQLNLPDDFWDTRSTLRHIRQAAHSRGRSADAVLGNVLARIAAHTPHSFVLPAIVGDYASLNMIIGIVGPSGTGKSTAISLAQHLVEPANQTPLGRLDNAPLGSGEGTIEAFFEMVAEEGDDGKKRMEKRQTTFAGLFVSDEIDQLAQQASRSGSTLMPTLRSAWSGGLLGQTNATGERNRRLNGHTYRFVLVVGVQPDKAAGLLDDAAGGTPQRFAWFNAVDPSIPEPGQRPDWPGPIRWANPHLLDDGLEVITLAGRRAGVINIDPVIAEEIAWNDHQRQTGQRNTGVGDSHRDLIRIKIAALLALLEGRTGIDKGDWELAEQVTDVSANILAAMTARAKEIVAERNLAQAAVASLIARRVAEDAEDDALETAVAQVARTAARLHQKGESMSRRKAMQNLSKKAREASLDEAFAVAVDRGLLVATTTEGEWTVPA